MILMLSSSAARALRDGRHQKIGKDIICQRIRSLPVSFLFLHLIYLGELT